MKAINSQEPIKQKKTTLMDLFFILAAFQNFPMYQLVSLRNNRFVKKQLPDTKSNHK